MIQEGIATTTHKDLHGDILTKEVLIKMASDINDSEFATGAGVDHDLLALPIGKTISAEVVTMDDGEYALRITQEIFENYRIVKLDNGQRFVRSSSLTDNRPYSHLSDFDNSNIEISVGKVNFSEGGYTEFCNSLHESIELQANIRKSFIPDPEMIITVVAGTFFYNVGKTLLEKASTDTASIYDIIKQSITNFCKHVLPSQKIPTYIFQDCYNTIVIQMIIKSIDVDVVMDSISSQNRAEIVKKTDEICSQFKPDKIQFCFDEVTNKWKITHFTTQNGEVFGTKETFRYTKKLLSKYKGLNELNLSLTGRVED